MSTTDELVNVQATLVMSKDVASRLSEAVYGKTIIAADLAPMSVMVKIDSLEYKFLVLNMSVPLN